jgi:Uma2 family endonuclease
MAAVYATTDQLDDWLEERHRVGLDTYDEWWEGTYRIVTGPTPEHGRLLNKLAVFLDPLAEAVGLHSAAPINVGTDKFDCRVPDLGIYHPDTSRTSPAFLTTAVLVVEVLSPGERSLEKLDFYEDHGVREYLEIDLDGQTVELWANADGWSRVGSSQVLAFDVVDGERIVAGHGDLDLRAF